MKRWKQFEEVCYQDLQNRLLGSEWTCVKKGGNHPRHEDFEIRRRRDDTRLMGIEAKLLPSHCGQFSLTEEEAGWVYSKRNAYPESAITKAILAHVNASEPVSQGGYQALNCPASLLYGWIRELLEHKQVHMLMTATNLNEERALIPVEMIEQEFQVEAVLRWKKSGSRKIPQCRREQAVEALKEFECNEQTAITGWYEVGGRLCVKFFSTPDPQRFQHPLFCLSLMGDQLYEVRQRSNTQNLNVLVTLSKKEGHLRTEGQG